MKRNTFLKFSSVLIAVTIVLVFSNVFFLPDKNISAQEEKELIQEFAEKCLIDPEIRNGFEAGKIPVGELVDYSELFGKEVLKNLNTIVSNTQAAINNSDKLCDLSEEFKCENCEIECREECEEDEDGNEIEDEDGNKTCWEVCWCDNFDQLMAKANGYVSAIEKNLDKIIDADANIYDLAHAEGPLVAKNPPLNRWKLATTLTDSRNKLENCLMGYARVLETKRATATLLNCMIALDRINLADLLVVPGFNKFPSKQGELYEELCFDELVPEIPSEVCYPYNSEYWLDEDQRNTCKQNKDSNDCYEAMKDLMYNFFCCIGGD